MKKKNKYRKLCVKIALVDIIPNLIDAFIAIYLSKILDGLNEGHAQNFMRGDIICLVAILVQRVFNFF